MPRLLAVTRLLPSREILCPVAVISIHKRKCKSADKGLFCFRLCLGQGVKGKLNFFLFFFLDCLHGMSVVFHVNFF